MGRIRRTPRAGRDLEEIWFFVAQDDPVAADRWLDTLEEKLSLIADNPLMGAARPDIAPELRYHPVGRYLLLYRLVSGGIEVVRVVHGTRDLLNLF
jgi:toxin ParE1/3/4